MNIAVHIEPANGAPPEVEYKWDADTDILSAQLKTRSIGDGMSGSVEVEGKDGPRRKDVGDRVAAAFPVVLEFDRAVLRGVDEDVEKPVLFTRAAPASA